MTALKLARGGRPPALAGVWFPALLMITGTFVLGWIGLWVLLP